MLKKLINVLNPVKRIWAKAKNYVIGLGVVAIIALAAYSGYLVKKNRALDESLGQSLNNLRQYEAIAAGMQEDNRVLQLKLSDLRLSNDSMIVSLEETRKSLKIKENELKQAYSVQTVIDTTVKEQLPEEQRFEVTQNCDFLIELEANPLTKATITRLNDSIFWDLKITNRQDLFVMSKKEYRNQGKNFFQRLFGWDWKKDVIERYEIANSNPAIKVTETRIIKIND